MTLEERISELEKQAMTAGKLALKWEIKARAYREALEEIAKENMLEQCIFIAQDVLSEHG